MGIIEFLFGKKPKIVFDKTGSVRHIHEEKKWNDWKDRFSKNLNYNWKNHTGKVGKSKK